VRALLENHPGAKDEFFKRYASQVERVITHVIGFDRELADILQHVFLQALRSLHTLEDASALGPWLSRVAALTARKVLRTRSRRSWLRLFTDSDDEARWEPAGTTLEHETVLALRAVYQLLDRLPADERIAFALRFIEGMSLAEVAAASSVSLATAKRRLQRAEKRFVAGARHRPELADWLKGSSRWQGP
jgi:RNA polymerase sigma-70 factor (ECF subfamily)